MSRCEDGKESLKFAVTTPAVAKNFGEEVNAREKIATLVSKPPEDVTSKNHFLNQGSLVEADAEKKPGEF